MPSRCRSSDDQLMQLIRRGSTEAFGELVGRWQGGLLGFFRRMGADPHRAEDAVQETLLRVFSYRHSYRPTPAGFRAFLFRVARNTLIDQRRRSRPYRAWLSLDVAREGSEAGGLGGYAPGWQPGASLALEWLDVESALRGLPEIHRVVILLNVFEGLSYREISEVLAVPVGTVKSRMYYALLRLREVLGVELKI